MVLTEIPKHIFIKNSTGSTVKQPIWDLKYPTIIANPQLAEYNNYENQILSQKNSNWTTKKGAILTRDLHLGLFEFLLGFAPSPDPELNPVAEAPVWFIMGIPKSKTEKGFFQPD